MTKNSAPHCQALLASIDWVVIGTISVPSEPAAETMPSVLLRRSSGTLRATAVITSDEAVHDSATPTIAPDTINDSWPVAVASTPSPAT
jgi:hypothetical protein